VTPHDEDDDLGVGGSETITQEDEDNFSFWAPAHPVSAFSMGTAKAMQVYLTLAVNLIKSDGQWCNHANRLSRWDCLFPALRTTQLAIEMIVVICCTNF